MLDAFSSSIEDTGFALLGDAQVGCHEWITVTGVVAPFTFFL